MGGLHLAALRREKSRARSARLGGWSGVTTKNDKEIVSALRKALADRVGKNRFELWFGESTQWLLGNGTLTIGVTSPFYQDWLRTNFRKDLEAICEETVGRPLAIEFRLESAPASPGSAGVQAPDGSQGREPSGASRSSAKSATVRPHLARPVESADDRHPRGSAHCGAAAPPAPAAELMPTDRTARPEPAPEPVAADGRAALGSLDRTVPACRKARGNTLDTFVVGQSNCLAYKSVEMASHRPGSMSPLVLHGPTGVGKTHLLEGMVNAYRKHRRQAAAVYLSAEQFTSQFVEALHGSGLPSFRRKYRDVGLLVIDDIQFFAGKRQTLVELLHTTDTLLRAGSQLVFAADRSPTVIKNLGPELIARLQGGMVCRMEPPEFETRLGIVNQLAAQLEMQVPGDVLAYVATHLTSQTRELAGALKRLHASSLALDRPITLALAEEALADLVQQHGRVVRLPDIEKAVCEVFGLEAQSLQSGRKGKAVSHPRMLAMWLARKYTRAALNEIGQFFGRRSHSTVISAQRKVDAWMAKGGGVAVADRPWTLDEAIRRVEEQLRAS